MASTTNDIGIQMLRPEELKIDRDYQRPIDNKHVLRILRDFSKLDIGVLTVSWRETGDFYVLDGQHRREALLRMGLGDRPVPCLVYVGLSIGEEAEIFSAQAKSKRIHPVDLFKARCFAGDSVALGIKAITDEFGYSIENQGRPDCIQGPATLERIYRIDGAERLYETLSIVSRIYTDDRHSVPVAIIGGVNAFLERYGASYDKERFVEIMAALPKTRIDQTALSMKQFIHDKGYSLYGRTFLHFYNGRMRGSRRLPDWEPESGSGKVSARAREHPEDLPVLQQKTA